MGPWFIAVTVVIEINCISRTYQLIRSEIKGELLKWLLAFRLGYLNDRWPVTEGILEDAKVLLPGGKVATSFSMMRCLHNSPVGLCVRIRQTWATPLAWLWEGPSQRVHKVMCSCKICSNKRYFNHSCLRLLPLLLWLPSTTLSVLTVAGWVWGSAWKAMMIH